MSLRVVKAAGACVVVDAGRWGHQRWGVSVGGPMDPVTWKLACVLAGQTDDYCALELTLGGMVFAVENGPIELTVCGALDHVLVNGRRVPSNRPLWLAQGAELKIPHMTWGSRCYLAPRDGFALDPVLGSRSVLSGCNAPTLMQGSLPANTRIGIRRLVPMASHAPARWTRDGAAAWPHWSVKPMHWLPSPCRMLRVVPSTLYEVPSQVLQEFLQNIWRVSKDCDRQGLRFEGKALHWVLPHAASEPAVAGSIQITPSGQPIVLAADRQPTGGYPVLGTVALADMCKLGQLKPGEQVQFVQIDLDHARQLYAKQHAGLAALSQAIAQHQGSPQLH